MGYFNYKIENSIENSQIIASNLIDFSIIATPSLPQLTALKLPRSDVRQLEVLSGSAY